MFPVFIRHVRQQGVDAVGHAFRTEHADPVMSPLLAVRGDAVSGQMLQEEGPAHIAQSPAVLEASVLRT